MKMPNANNDRQPNIFLKKFRKTTTGEKIQIAIQ